jgi:hypothetical protein
MFTENAKTERVNLNLPATLHPGALQTKIHPADTRE